VAPTIDELTVTGAPESWSALGFDVDGDAIPVGTAVIRLGSENGGRGLVRWSLRDVASTELDGLPTERSERPLRPAARAHPNGVDALDHVVAFTPDLERTVPALEAVGLDLRRRREGPTPGGAQRQAFFRLAEVILEVIEHPEGVAAAADRDAPASLWGLAFAVSDIDALPARLGDLLGPVRPAVQPDRRIAPVRRAASLSAPVAFITRPPAARE
jgi:Glyoxalase-like domain